MHAHIHMCIHIHLHIHTHTYTYIHIRTYTYIHVHTYIYTDIHTHIYIHSYECIFFCLMFCPADFLHSSPSPHFKSLKSSNILLGYIEWWSPKSFLSVFFMRHHLVLTSSVIRP